MKYLFYIFLFLFWANAFAQNNFHSTYDYNNQNDFGIVILESNQLSNLVIFGNTTRGIRGAKILFVDSMGSSPIHLNYSYVSNPSFNGGLKNGNSYYGYGAQYNPIEGAADSYLLKMNLMGDTLRTVSSNFAFNDRIHDMHLKADSTFIVYGFYTDTIPAERKPYVANIDTLGNVLWFKTHSKLGFDATIVNLQATAAGGYVFSGVEEETPGGHLDLFLTKVDSVGNLVWKKYYHELLSQKKGHVEVLHDGNYALFGTGYHPQGAQRAILKIDQAGNLIWRRKHGINNLDEGYNVGKELPNGNFICAGSSIRMYNGLQVDDINLSMLDSAGNLLWSRDYNYHGLDINQYVRDLIVTSDGGFAMTGFILNAPGGTGNDVFVLKTDTNGLITSLNSGFREVTPDMRVYPNPTKDFVNVPYVEGLERIELYDVGGKLLQNFVILSDSRSVNKIDLSNYTNGIYILKLYMKNGEIYSKKVIKE
jgi:hypothetical protein